jgi:hypothetical protein
VRAAHCARLTDLYLDEAIPLDEFKKKKTPLMQEKIQLEQKVLQLERAKVNRHEPLRNWIFEANQAQNWAFFRKLGGNEIISPKSWLEPPIKGKNPFRRIH